MSEEEFAAIRQLQSKIDVLHEQLYVLQEELYNKKALLKADLAAANKELASLKVPGMLRDLYVMTYYYRGCYAWQHAIFYGSPRATQYKQALSLVEKEPSFSRLKVPTSEFNKIVLDPTSKSEKPDSRKWTEPLREVTDPPLPSIDRSVIYVLTDSNEKSDYETVLGVYVDPKLLVKDLCLWFIQEEHKIREVFLSVDLYLVEGNESCVLVPNKECRKAKINPAEYPPECISIAIAKKTRSLLLLNEIDI